MRRQRDERGAVALFAALVVVVLLGVGALAVDIGTQRVARADMQALADVVAMDLARQLDGRPASAVEAGLEAAKDQSVARNSDTIGQDVVVDAELGTIDDSGVFSQVGGETVPDAVRVSTSASVPFSFVSGSGGVGRTAVAVARAQGCYKLGSWGARLSTASNATLLHQVLQKYGIGASVSAATYQSLVGATVDVSDLAAALGLASPEALGTTSVSLSTFLTAVAQVVSSNGSTAGQVAALNTVRADLGTLGGRSIAVSKLVSVASGAGSGLDAAADVADLVVGAILVANGGSAATVDLSALDPTGFTSITADATLVQGAALSCGFAGSAPSTSNQVVLHASAKLKSQTFSVLGLLTTLSALVPDLVSVSAAPGSSDVDLQVSVAQATGTLDALSCNASARSATVGTSGGLMTTTLTVPVTATVVKSSLPLVAVVKGSVTFTTTTSPAARSVSFTVPPDAYDTPKSNGGTSLQLPTTSTSQTVSSNGGLSDAQARAALTTVADQLIGTLNSSLVSPLSDLAGLTTAGADVLLMDHPSCTTPALRG